MPVSQSVRPSCYGVCCGVHLHIKRQQNWLVCGLQYNEAAKQITTTNKQLSQIAYKDVHNKWKECSASMKYNNCPSSLKGIIDTVSECTSLSYERPTSATIDQLLQTK